MEFICNLSFCPSAGSDSVEGECVFEGDYAVPPLPVTEGMQHIRIMEGVSRSLPSSPLLSHQALNMRLQPLKRLPGNTACVCWCVAVVLECVCQREPPPVSHLKHSSWMPELPPRAQMPSPYTRGECERVCVCLRGSNVLFLEMLIYMFI